MKSKIIAVASIVAVMFAAAVYAGEIKLEGVKCLMNPKAKAKAEKSVAYKDGKVFFCCDGCAGKFAKAKDAKATAANAQLVQTGQYKQEKCPLSGGKLNASQTVKVNGVEVSFCCGNCKGKVAKAGEKQADLVFSNKAFEKGFKLAKKD